MKFIVSILLISTGLGNCSKSTIQAGNQVTFHLLQFSQSLPGICQVDPASAVLAIEPIVRNEDILQYSRKSFEYTISDAAVQKIKAWGGRVPFAVKVDQEVIYYGYYMPSFMSSTCEHSITMDIHATQRTLTMSLGYPWQEQGISINDQRNNAKLLATLKKQGKLR